MDKRLQNSGVAGTERVQRSRGIRVATTVCGWRMDHGRWEFSAIKSATGASLGHCDCVGRGCCAVDRSGDVTLSLACPLQASPMLFQYLLRGLGTRVPKKGGRRCILFCCIGRLQSSQRNAGLKPSRLSLQALRSSIPKASLSGPKEAPRKVRSLKSGRFQSWTRYRTVVGGRCDLTVQVSLIL